MLPLWDNPDSTPPFFQTEMTVTTGDDGYYFYEFFFRPDRLRINVQYPGYLSQEITFPAETSYIISDFYLKRDLDPVILVPGVMGSWKYGPDISESEAGWITDPMFHTYDNLIEAFLKNGYVKGKNFFVFPYNWRISNQKTALYLADFIKTVKEKTKFSKVDIVAHSMGGLMVREYVASDYFSHDIDQIVFLDVPHLGSPKSYLVYEGGYFKGMLDSVLKYILHIWAAGDGYFSLPHYIQDKVPSIKELLPVYDYLWEKNKNNEYQIKPYPAGYPTNQFLENLNTEFNLGKLKEETKILNIYSLLGLNTQETLGGIKVKPDSNIYDHSWPDGEPVWKEDWIIKTNGDGTVPEKSLSALEGVETMVKFGVNHRQLPTEAQQDIIEFLTGQRPQKKYTYLGPVKRFLFIRVYSPVDFLIISPDGKKLGKDFQNATTTREIANAFYSGFDQEAEFAIIPNPQDGEYKVLLEGTATGTYQLGIDLLDDNNNTPEKENYFSGITYPNKREDYIFSVKVSSTPSTPILTVRKKVTRNDFLEDLEELYRRRDISLRAYRFLKKQIRHLGARHYCFSGKPAKKHKKIFRLRERFCRVLLRTKQKLLLHKLRTFYRKSWLTKDAYQILKQDIDSFFKNLQDK